jgi:hypothetical protein
MVRAVDRRVEANNSGRASIIGGIEEKQVDSGCVLRVNAEVYSFGRNGRA